MKLLNMLAESRSRRLATSADATFATDQGPPSVATVARIAVANEVVCDPEFAPDPDRYCWPASSAMNDAEIDLMIWRSALFQRRGLPGDEADALADKLVLRDRELDERRLCMECSNLRRGQCIAWQAAGVTRDVGGMVLMLQRCPGFVEGI